MRALLIAPYIFPHENPRAHRWTELGAALCERGWSVDVVTSKAPGHELMEWHRGMKVYRTGHHSLKSFLARPGNPAGSGSGSRLVRWFNRYFVRSWYWPDDAWIWQKPAIKQTRALLQSERYDVLISVALPFTAHRVAWKLMDEFPDICWLADTGDPFSLQVNHSLNNKVLYDGVNFRAERSVLEHAAMFIVPAKAMQKLYVDTWPEFVEKLVVLPPVCTMPVSTGTAPEHSGPVRIGMFGSFYQGVRDPDLLLLNLNSTSDYMEMELHMFGARHPAVGRLRKKMDDETIHIYEHGLIPRSELPEAMGQMDVLLLLGNMWGVQLPSKIVDYLASGRPILHVQQDENDPILEYLKDHPLACSVNILDWEEEEERVIRFLKKCRGEQVPKAWREARLQAHRPEVLAEKLEAIINQASRK